MAIEIEVKSNSRQARSDLGQLNKTVTGLSNRVEKSAQRIQKAVTLVGTGLAAIVATKGLANIADNFTNIENRIALVTGRTKELSTTFTELQTISIKTRGNLAGVADLYNRLGRSTKNLGVSNQELLDVTQTIQKAITISGADAQAANAAIVQLGQGLAAGALRGQELNSVMEQSTRVAQAIADELGVGIGGLRGLAEEGKITSEVVIRAFQNQRAAIDKEFTQVNATVGQGTLVAGQGISFVISEFLKGTGVITFVADKLVGLGTTFQELGPSSRELGESLNSIFTGGVEKAKPVVDSLKESILSFSKSISVALSPISNFANKVVGYFKWAYEEIVGSSYWPDTMRGVMEWATAGMQFAQEAISKGAEGILAIFSKIPAGVGLILAGFTIIAFSSVTAVVSVALGAISIIIAAVAGEALILSSAISNIASQIKATFKSSLSPIDKIKQTFIILGTTVWSVLVGQVVLAISLVVSSIVGLVQVVVVQASLIYEAFKLIALGAVTTLLSALSVIRDFSESVIEYFKEIYDKVVGNSYWPDTIKGVTEWSELLDKGLKPVVQFSRNVISIFKNLFDNVKDFTLGGVRSTREFFEELINGSFGFRAAFREIRSDLSTGFTVAVNLALSGIPKVRIAAIALGAALVTQIDKFLDYIEREFPQAFDIAAGLALSIVTKKFGAGNLGFIAVSVGNALATGLSPEKLIEALEAAVSFLGKGLGRAFGSFVANLDTIVAAIGIALVKIVTDFGKAFLDELGFIGDAIQVLTLGLGNILVGAFAGGLILRFFSKVLFGFELVAEKSGKKAGKRAKAGFISASKGFFENLKSQGGILGVIADKMRRISKIRLVGTGNNKLATSLKRIIGLTDVSIAQFKVAASELATWVKWQFISAKATLTGSTARAKATVSANQLAVANTRLAGTYTAVSAAANQATASTFASSSANTANSAGSLNILNSISGSLEKVGKGAGKFADGLTKLLSKIPGKGKLIVAALAAVGLVYSSNASAAEDASDKFDDLTKKGFTLDNTLRFLFGKVYKTTVEVELTDQSVSDVEKRLTNLRKNLVNELKQVKEVNLLRLALGRPSEWDNLFRRIGVEGELTFRKLSRDVKNFGTIATTTLASIFNSEFVQNGIRPLLDKLGIDEITFKPKFKIDDRDEFQILLDEAGIDSITLPFKLDDPDTEKFLGQEFRDKIANAVARVEELQGRVAEAVAAENDSNPFNDPFNLSDLRQALEFEKQRLATAVEEGRIRRNSQILFSEVAEELSVINALNKQANSLLGEDLVNVKSMSEFLALNREEQVAYLGASQGVGQTLNEIVATLADAENFTPEERINLVSKLVAQLNQEKIALEQIGVELAKISKFDLAASLNFTIPEFSLLPESSKQELIDAQQRIEDLKFQISQAKALGDSGIIDVERLQKELDQAEREASKTAANIRSTLYTPLENIVNILSDSGISTNLDDISRINDKARESLKSSAASLKKLSSQLNDPLLTPAERETIKKKFQELARKTQKAYADALEEANDNNFEKALRPFRKIGASIDTDSFKDLSATVSAEILQIAKNLEKVYDEINNGQLEGLALLEKVAEFNKAVFDLQERARKAQEDALRSERVAEDIAGGLSQGIMSALRGDTSIGEAISNVFLNAMNKATEERITAVLTNLFEKVFQSKGGLLDLFSVSNKEKDKLRGKKDTLDSILPGEKEEEKEGGMLSRIFGGKEGGPKVINGALLVTDAANTVDGGLANSLLPQDETSSPLQEGVEEGAQEGAGFFQNVFKQFEGGFDGILSNFLGSFQGLFKGIGQLFSGGGFGGFSGGGGWLGAAMTIAGAFFHNGGLVPDGGGYHKMNGGEMVLTPKQQQDLFMAAKGGHMADKQAQQFNINITGDISRQTKKEIYGMLPSIATGVNQFNKENSIG